MNRTLPRLRPDLVIKQVGHHHIVKDPVSNEFFRLDEKTGAYLNLFDGAHTLEDLSGVLGLDREETERLVDTLDELGFFRVPSPKKRKSSWHYALWPAFNPENLFKRLTPLAKLMYGKTGLVVQVMIAMVGIYLFIRNFFVISSSAAVLLSPAGIFAAWLGVVVISLVHECGHALALTAFGGTISEMGVILLMLVPGFYTDVSDSYFIAQRWKRLVVLAAGPLLELVFWSLGIVLWLVFRPGGFAGMMLLGAVTIAGVRSLLFNLNPLLRTDGYFMLEEILGVTNLYDKAFDPEQRTGWIRVYAAAVVAYGIALVGLSVWSAVMAVKSGNTWTIVGMAVFLILIFGSWLGARRS